MTEPATYLIAKLPDPASLPDYGLAWWDMEFVTINDNPTPFKSREDAESYLDAWPLRSQGFEIYALTKVQLV